jgi:hypothetical protein
MSIEAFVKRLDEAVAMLRGEGEAVHICAHIAGSPEKFCCVKHVAAGVLCAECVSEHFKRHPEIRRCDLCDGELPLQPLAMSVEIPGLLSATRPGLPRGVEALVPMEPAMVLVVGAFGCARCSAEWEAADREIR